MHYLGISDLVLKVPTKISERIERNEVLRKIRETDIVMEISVELAGITYVCSFDHSTKLIDDLGSLKKGRELLKPDYVDRWEELTSNHDIVERPIILTAYSASPRTSGLGIKAIGLDPEDPTGYFVRVAGVHRSSSPQQTKLTAH